jgi:hypothetical protein
MQKHEQGFITEDAFLGFMLVLVAIGVFIGWLFFVGMPWVWGVLKPVIHAVTA